ASTQRLRELAGALGRAARHVVARRAVSVAARGGGGARAVAAAALRNAAGIGRILAPAAVRKRRPRACRPARPALRAELGAGARFAVALAVARPHAGGPRAQAPARSAPLSKPPPP